MCLCADEGAAGGVIGSAIRRLLGVRGNRQRGHYQRQEYDYRKQLASH
jgi:hypothetical protein